MPSGSDASALEIINMNVTVHSYITCSLHTVDLNFDIFLK